MIGNYLVVYNENTGFCNIANVGIFKNTTETDAAKEAKKAWRLENVQLYVVLIDDLPDGWSYYI